MSKQESTTAAAPAEPTWSEQVNEAYNANREMPTESRRIAVQAAEGALNGNRDALAVAAIAAVVYEVDASATQKDAAAALGVSAPTITRWLAAGEIVSSSGMAPSKAYAVASRTNKKQRTAAIRTGLDRHEKATAAGQRSTEQGQIRKALTEALGEQHAKTRAARPKQEEKPQETTRPEHTPAPVSQQVSAPALLAGLTKEAETAPAVDYAALIRAAALALALAERINPAEVTTSQLAALAEARATVDALADRLAEIDEAIQSEAAAA